MPVMRVCIDCGRIIPANAPRSRCPELASLDNQGRAAKQNAPGRSAATVHPKRLNQAL
jgi:hypothetical protein